MYCTKCGVEFEDHSAYCTQCGTPTGWQSATSAAVPRPRLTRAIYDKKIAGVCGGLSEYLSVDPTVVRLIWLVATICFPPFLLGYFAAWIVVPKEAPRLPFSAGAGIPQPQQ